ncbi:hypothetical protein ABW21_db0200314 [Orbilia brochopaga]|nr:hypothetical protein ABW21_db0200314 [Drechslerella brochopaga]
MGMAALVTPSRVWIVVYSGMPGQFIGTAEAFGAAWKCACMRFFAGMGSDVAGLVLKSVETTTADRALVRPRHLLGLRFRSIVVFHDLGEVGDSGTRLCGNTGFDYGCKQRRSSGSSSHGVFANEYRGQVLLVDCPASLAIVRVERSTD